jgi:gluconokinase
MILVLMGVSGSGKSTVGRILADKLGWTFMDADDFHPAANIEKMRRGIPLDDADRRPWLDVLRQRMAEACRNGENVVVACSALKHRYQDYLEQDDPPCVRYVYLFGSAELIAKRLAARKGHFMDPGLLGSQFEALEPPAAALRVDIARTPKEIVAEIRERVGV